jgi:hypothetical protein
MKFIKIAVLSAFIVGSFAANGAIKSRLNELSKKNLVEMAVEAECDPCGCDLPSIDPVDLSFCPGGSGALPPTGSAGSATTTIYDTNTLTTTGSITG